MIVSNSVNHLEPTIYLVDPKVINEFYLKETDHYRRVEQHKTLACNMFYMIGGDEGLAHKGVFADFFRYDKVQELMPSIQKIFM